MRKSLLLLMAAVTIVSAIAQTQLPRALIITGNGNVPTYKKEYPPWIHEFQNDKVKQILQGIATVEVSENLNVLNPDRLAAYDLVISNSMFLTPTEEQLNALYEFVSQGKAYLTLHCGILSLLNWDRYEEFIGGIFIGGPATVPERFRVSTTNMEFWGYTYPFRKDEAEHPVSLATDDFVTKDELYYFQPNTRDFHVIARAENHPVMWWHPVGRGKVMSLTLGHDEEAKDNPGYQALLRHGVQWLTGMPLIYGAQPRKVSTRQLTYENFMSLTAATHLEDSDIRFEITGNSNRGVFVAETTPSGKVTLRLTGKAGHGTFDVQATEKNGLSSTKTYRIEVVQDGTGNIAAYHGNTATISSSENESAMFYATNVIDNDPSTRWSSAAVDTAWVTIDLQKVYSVGKLVLSWEGAYAAEYDIQASEDGRNWNTIKTVSDGDGKTDELNFDPTPMRYVRILATSRAEGRWGYSLFEVEVYKK
jgi:type 1 glutamine amidotransferase